MLIGQIHSSLGTLQRGHYCYFTDRKNEIQRCNKARSTNESSAKLAAKLVTSHYTQEEAGRSALHMVSPDELGEGEASQGRQFSRTQW